MMLEIKENMEVQDNERQGKFVEYRKWYPVNTDYTSVLLTLSKVSPLARCVFDLLCGLCDKGNDIVCTYTAVAQMLHSTRQRIKSACELLSEFRLASTRRDGNTLIISVNPAIIKKTGLTKVYRNTMFAFNGQEPRIPDSVPDNRRVSVSIRDIGRGRLVNVNDKNA